MTGSVSIPALVSSKDSTQSLAEAPVASAVSVAAVASVFAITFVISISQNSISVGRVVAGYVNGSLGHRKWFKEKSGERRFF